MEEQKVTKDDFIQLRSQLQNTVIQFDRIPSSRQGEDTDLGIVNVRGTSFLGFKVRGQWFFVPGFSAKKLARLDFQLPVTGPSLSAGTVKSNVLEAGDSYIAKDNNVSGDSNLQDVFINGELSLKSPTELTIASGVITVTKSYHTVDTEGDAGTDDLDTINGGQAGGVLVLQAASSSRTVVLKDGTGNLQLAGDFSLDNTQDSVTLIYDGSIWIELSRSNNGV